MRPTTKNALEAGQGFKGTDHNIPAGDLMNNTTVAPTTDILRVDGFNPNQYTLKDEVLYLLLWEERPQDSFHTSNVKPVPLVIYGRLGERCRARLLTKGYRWGDENDWVFTTLGIAELVSTDVGGAYFRWTEEA